MTLVIGLGSTLRRDDSVGQEAARVVEGWNLPDVRALPMIQLTPELAENLASARRAIFVDAKLVPDGENAQVEVSTIEPLEGSFSIGHASDPRALLALARGLFGRSPESWLVTIPAVDISLGEGLSPAARQGLEEALGRVKSLIERGH